MQAREVDSVAFSRPGGELSVFSPERPVDLGHLKRQTLGDRQVEAEVLGLFVRQICSARERLAATGVAERANLAHALKGSALGIGAFGLAKCAAELEERPQDACLLDTLATRIDEVRTFIAAINR